MEWKLGKNKLMHGWMVEKKDVQYRGGDGETRHLRKEECIQQKQM